MLEEIVWCNAIPRKGGLNMTGTESIPVRLCLDFEQDMVRMGW